MQILLSTETSADTFIFERAGGWSCRCLVYEIWLGNNSRSALGVDSVRAAANIEVPRNSVILIIKNRMKSYALMRCRCTMLPRYIVYDRQTDSASPWTSADTQCFSTNPVQSHPNPSSRISSCGCTADAQWYSPIQHQFMGLHCSFSRIHNIPVDPAPGARDWLRDSGCLSTSYI